MTQAIDASNVLPVIGRIYDAALDANMWPEVVRQIATLQDSDKALLFTPLLVPRLGGFTFPVGIPESAMQQWADKYAPYDIWSQAVVEKGLFVEGNTMTDSELVPHESFLGSAWYCEFLSKIAIARVCTGIVFGLQSPPPLMPTSVAVFRNVNAPAFGVRERTMHGMLIPHISRALGIMFRLRDAELKVASTLSGFDRLASGIVLLDARGAVVFANRAARRIVQMEDGLRLRIAPKNQTWIKAESHDAQQAIDAAIKQCTDRDVVKVSHFSNAVRIARPSGRAAYTLNFSALPEQNEFGSGADRPCAIVFLNDPDEPVRVDAEVLKRLYALTTAECRLAAHLCDGETLATIAHRLGVRESTLKTQLQAIFDKTGTRRQVQLVKLMVSLASSAT